MPSFPEFCFFSAKTSALPIDSVRLDGTVVTGEDDHRVVDEFVTVASGLRFLEGS